MSAAAADLRGYVNREGHDWAILDQLVEMDEAARRYVLRSHRERGFGGDSDDDRVTRERLDDALERLTLVEIGIQTGIIQDPDFAIATAAQEALLKLAPSSAFARYLNLYLYFGVAFLIGRMAKASTLSAAANQVTYQEINEWPLELPSPPPLEDEYRGQAELLWPELIAGLRELEADGDMKDATEFLDDFVEGPGERAQFELWLRGLYATQGHHRFRQLTNGLREFTAGRLFFYDKLEFSETGAYFLGRSVEVCSAKNPLTARFGLIDFYLFARLLRADVSASGIVAYEDLSWLQLIAASLGRSSEAHDVIPERAWLGKSDEAVRAVFEYTCDLIQNAIQIAREQLAQVADPSRNHEPPPETVRWRTAYDEELEEIARQRKERRFDAQPKFEERAAGPGTKRSPWSRRIHTGEHVEDLVGLALSGGGIRSATFNLGVLEQLQDIDMLRKVDYLSTVSGGGYIGAWLIGNVRRTEYWLSRLTDWRPSIDHLRRFSNYLAPRTGLMSADTWSMWATWVRNALLIQATAVAWVALLLVLSRLGFGAFTAGAFETLAVSPGNLILGGIIAGLTLSVRSNLNESRKSAPQWRVLLLAVIPTMTGAFVTGAMLWAQRSSTAEHYSDVLKQEYRVWALPLLLLFLSFTVLSYVSIDSGMVRGNAGPAKAPRKLRRVAFSVATAAGALAVVYLGLCAIQWLFSIWAAWDQKGAWLAYTLGPSLVLLAITLAVVAIIGFVGHDSQDWRREWWTRFGSWLGMYGAIVLALGVVSAFGPWLVLRVFAWGKWSVLGTWAVAVVGGLLSGNSSRSDGEAERALTAKAIGWFAQLAAVLFIVGAVLLTACGLHAAMLKIFSSETLTLQTYWDGMRVLTPSHYGWLLLWLLGLGALFSWRFEINVFGLNQFYRNRLVRCYLGATRWLPGLRRPHRFTGFDKDDDISLSQLRHGAIPHRPFRGPFPVINCALNLGGSSDLSLHTRHSASFTLTPLRAGADRAAVGYAPTTGGTKTFAGGVPLGQAVSVSGAAASPNSGYNTSPLVAVLLTMFNVRLGWWFPNPGRGFWSAQWLRFSLWYLVKEMFGMADERNLFVNVSDGGHFDNLGIYELVRRRCKVIIASDAECDPDLAFGSLGSVIRMCETDFGAKISLDVESIRKKVKSAPSQSHCAAGRITYANGSCGYLIYLKSSMTGDEDTSVQQYAACHPRFPHETTGDQFFAEDQFESYRRLGRHVASVAFRGVEDEQSPIKMAESLSQLWVPSAASSELFVTHTTAVDTIWERFRRSPGLADLWTELTADVPGPLRGAPTMAEHSACLELFQVMENAYVALRLDEFWTHPDNRGWTVLFGSWAKSACFRDVWSRSQGIFGIRFVHFCHQRLGLPK